MGINYQKLFKMVCENSHSWVRLAVIGIFTIYLFIIFQAWYDVYKNTLLRLLGVDSLSEAQVLWSTVFITGVFLIFVKIGLNAEIEPIILSQGFG